MQPRKIHSHDNGGTGKLAKKNLNLCSGYLKFFFSLMGCYEHDCCQLKVGEELIDKHILPLCFREDSDVLLQMILAYTHMNKGFRLTCVLR